MTRIILEHVDHVVEVNEGSIFILPDRKAFLVTRHSTQPNPFTPTFTIMSMAQG